jgi:5-methyltetrahydropteroyltriglutamate--homocysteine methyltransferase
MRSSDRILTTHVGSLIRPADLLDFIVKRQEGRPYDEAAYQDCLQRAVSDVVRQQAEAGIDIVSDGEYGKSFSWSRYVLDRMQGFEQRFDGTVGVGKSILGKDHRDFAEFYKEYEEANGFAGMGKNLAKLATIVITGPIKYTGQPAVAHDAALLRAAMRNSGVDTGFMPVVAPASVAPARQDQFYRTEEEALFAIASALHDEYKAVLDAGFIVQIDDAFLASHYDVMVPPASLADYKRWAGVRIDALNHASKGLPAEKIRYHVCWGSWNGPHTNDVALRDIVDLLLRLNVGGYSLEMANARHEHEWRVWEDVKLPDDKTLLPGVITHSTNVVEHPELVAERIVRLANLVGRENVIASTDCGFAQGPFARRVHPSIMWAKLKSLADGAALASKALWARRAA